MFFHFSAQILALETGRVGGCNSFGAIPIKERELRKNKFKTTLS
jgi:hypothetical protein